MFLGFVKGQDYFDKEEFQLQCSCVSCTQGLPRCSLERVSPGAGTAELCHRVLEWAGRAGWPKTFKKNTKEVNSQGW